MPPFSDRLLPRMQSHALLNGRTERVGARPAPRRASDSPFRASSVTPTRLHALERSAIHGVTARGGYSCSMPFGRNTI